jgi:hypothetical protein
MGASPHGMKAEKQQIAEHVLLKQQRRGLGESSHEGEPYPDDQVVEAMS